MPSMGILVEQPTKFELAINLKTATGSASRCRQRDLRPIGIQAQYITPRARFSFALTASLRSL
jgi:hypothetical protein